MIRQYTYGAGQTLIDPRTPVGNLQQLIAGEIKAKWNSTNDLIRPLRHEERTGDGEHTQSVYQIGHFRLGTDAENPGYYFVLLAFVTKWIGPEPQASLHFRVMRCRIADSADVTVGQPHAVESLLDKIFAELTGPVCKQLAVSA